ncbi:MAG: peptide ABC transporter substrate-binding protein [Verrucomicrobiota bacterium]
MTTKPVRNITPALLAAGCLAFLTGCPYHSSGPKETPVVTGNRDQILHFGNGTEPADLDPQTVTGVPEHHLMLALFEGLAGGDPKTLEPIPAAAETWDVSEDGKVYTFHLRKDAKWSNGDPVTADDFYWSYRRILTPTLGAEYVYMHYIVKNAREYYDKKITDFSEVGYKVIDPHTLEITLNAPTPYFLQLLHHYSWYPVHPATVEKFGGTDKKGTQWTRPENLVGNGPYTLASWKLNHVIVVKKSETYWDRDAVKIKEIHFYPTEDEHGEERDFRAERLHVTNILPFNKIDVYREKNPELLMLDAYLGTYYYRFNVTKPPLNDVRVRRALSLAIDRQKIVQFVTKGGETPAVHFVPPKTMGYTSTTRLEPDVVEAKRLLAEAGFPDGANFPQVELLYNTSERHRGVAQAIQQMWKQSLNVEVGLVNAEWKVYLDRQSQLDYDISRAGWIGDYIDPNTFMDMWLTGGGNNDTGWSNLEYDRLIKQAGETVDETARYQLFQQAEKILLDESPIMPIYFYTKVYLKQPSLQGWYPNLLNTHPYKFLSLVPDEGN